MEPRISAVLLPNLALGAVCLAWPLLNYANIFLFDAPIQSRADEAARYAFFWSTACYPLFFLVGAFLSIRAYRRGRSSLRVLGLALIPLLNPAPWLAAFVAASLALGRG